MQQGVVLAPLQDAQEDRSTVRIAFVEHGPESAALLGRPEQGRNLYAWSKPVHAAVW